MITFDEELICAGSGGASQLFQLLTVDFLTSDYFTFTGEVFVDGIIGGHETGLATKGVMSPSESEVLHLTM